MLRYITLALLINLSLSVCAQTIFTFGNKKVSKQEFMLAFEKNNKTFGKDKITALKEYLNLYIRYKLKVQAAFDEHINEDPNIVAEYKNFKKQITENLIDEEANIAALQKEAFSRSRIDIHVGEIFIPFTSPSDTIAAYQKIQLAYGQLKKGVPFENVASTYNSDTLLAKAKGDIGYITVFSLKYPYENEIFSLAPQSFSAPFKSNTGYHIFENLGNRPAMGKRKFAQIFLAIPPNPTAAEKERGLKYADSLYKLLVKGASFDKFAELYSNDPHSAGVGGEVPEIGVGETDPEYEKKVFSLSQPGEIAKPFYYGQGYYIFKLLKVIPVGKGIEDNEYFSYLQSKLEKDNRLAEAKLNLVNTWLRRIHYTPTNSYDVQSLWAFTDTCLRNKSLKQFNGIQLDTKLFLFEDSAYLASDWLDYIKSRQQSNAPSKYEQPFQDFIKEKCKQYYRSNYERYNKSMKKQLEEFNDANVLFSVMDRHVWSKASQDSAALLQFYNQHQKQYVWKPGIAAVIISSKNKETIQAVAKKLGDKNYDWHSITTDFNNQAFADSGRYEYAQLPLKGLEGKPVGYLSDIKKSPVDSSYGIALITSIFPTSNQRGFEDARGLVINDYQQYLEDKWIEELKKQYPVVINEENYKKLQ